MTGAGAGANVHGKRVNFNFRVIQTQTGVQGDYHCCLTGLCWLQACRQLPTHCSDMTWDCISNGVVLCRPKLCMVQDNRMCPGLPLAL